MAFRILRNRLLCQCPDGLFAVPSSRLSNGNKCVFISYVNYAGVLFDLRRFQKDPAAFVDSDCLEMIESIAHEIDRGAFFHRQRLCAFVGENDGDRNEDRKEQSG